MYKSQTIEDNSQSQTEKTQSEDATLLIKDDHNIQYGGILTPANDIPHINSDTKDENKCMKLYRYVTTLTIEPAVFCFMFAYFMDMNCMTNMMIDKGCLNHLNYSVEICGNLSNHPQEKKNSEMLATDYSLYSNFTNLIGAFLMIFIAPWSDKYGRKIPLMLSVLGFVVTDTGLILCTIHFSSGLEYLVLSKIPCQIFGGFICVMTIFYSHASEVSSEKNRAIKYTSVEIAFGLGIALGGLAGGFLYRYYGYYYVYVSVASFHSFCLVWVFFVVEETTGLEKELTWSEKAMDFFVCRSFKDGIQTTFKPRDGYKRALMILLLLSMCIVILSYESFANVAYVYVYHVYDWDPTTYSIANTTYMLVQLTCALVLIPVFLQVLKIGDYTLGMFGSISMMMKNLIIAFSKYHSYIYYIGLLSGCFGNMIAVSVRTSVSKLVGKDELGRVFSFLATCESILPMLGIIVVTQVFETTIDIFPSVAYCLAVVFLSLPLGTFIWAFIITKNSSLPAYCQVPEKA